MNTLKFSLEYDCFPVWNYAPDGHLIENDLPEDLQSDIELEMLLTYVQRAYDSLYNDGASCYSCMGFVNSDDNRPSVVSLMERAADLVRDKYSDKYNVEFSA